MNEKFDAVTITKAWEITDTGIISGKNHYPFDSLAGIAHISKASFFSNGVAMITTKNNHSFNIAYTKKDKERAEAAIDVLTKIISGAYIASKPGIKYTLNGANGKCMDVYDDRVSIITPTFGSVGEKDIYYCDVIGVQIKSPSLSLGYIQLETSSVMMENLDDDLENENTFAYNKNQISPELINEVINFIRNKVSECKSNKNTTVIAQVSSADELKKFKELLDMGVLTQEEFDAKKKQLLGL